MYYAWRDRAVRKLQRESRIIATARGPLECRMSGRGPAILIVHGTPGGYDQSFAFSRLLHSDQHTSIAISRPGYLRTPLSSGKTPEEQADLYAALLDVLGIDQTVIIGISGGGPSALQFALRHPARCHQLVMVSGVAQRYSELELQLTWPPLKRWLKQLYNRLIILDPLLYLVLPLTRLLPQASASEDLLRSVMMYDLRKAGYDNDMYHLAEMLTYPLENITAPTFVLHGTADDEVPFADAELLGRKITNIRLVVVKGGSHQVFYTHAATVMPLLRQFLAASGAA